MEGPSTSAAAIAIIAQEERPSTSKSSNNGATGETANNAPRTPKRVRFREVLTLEQLRELHLTIRRKTFKVLSLMVGVMALCIFIIQITAVAVCILSDFQYDILYFLAQIIWIPLISYILSGLLTWLIATKAMNLNLLGFTLGCHIFSALVGFLFCVTAVVLMASSARNGSDGYYNGDFFAAYEPLICSLLFVFNFNAAALSIGTSVKIVRFACYPNVHDYEEEIHGRRVHVVLGEDNKAQVEESVQEGENVQEVGQSENQDRIEINVV